MRTLLALLLAAAATPAAAQVTFKIHSGADSAFGLVPGQTVMMPVYTDNSSSTINRARLTFHYDPSKLTIVGMLPDFGGLYHTIDTVRTATSFTVGASGFLAGGNQRSFSLRVRLAAGATDGTFLRMEVDSLLVSAPAGNQSDRAGSHIGQLCHATQQYGDVDVSGQVDSRDALIVLSASIGLPAAGFALNLGDVDLDNAGTSRDALFILSHAVGTSIFAANRTGVGVPDVCPLPQAAPDRLVYVRRGATADSLFTLPGGSTTPAFVPGTEDAAGEINSPRLAGDGVSIAYNCRPPSGSGFNRICRINTDGTGLTDIIAAAFTENDRPDWIPGDSVVAYRRGFFLVHRTDPSGASDQQLSSGSFSANAIAWNRAASAIAYTGSGQIRLLASNGSSDVPVTTTGVIDHLMVRWNATGDSIAFTRSGVQGIWAVPAAGGTPARLTSLAVPQFEEFDWTSQGLIFRVNQPNVRGVFLLPAGGGPPVRLTSGNDVMPAARRNP